MAPFGSASGAAIDVSVDRNPVGIDESFQLLFSTNESPDGEPDFSPLEQDFDIVSQSSGSNMSWLNGKASKTVQWTLTVMARQPGNLTIPAIKFGSSASPATSITVTPASASTRLASEDDVMLEVEALPKEPYVQSQVLYTVRIYSKVEIVRAALNDPELDNAVIEKLGDDSHYATRIKGVDYAVTERRYVLFPQQSGKVSIKPLILNAEILTGNRSGFNSFFGSQMTRTRRVASNAIDLNVRPAPATFTGGHWLSAEQLALSDDWSGDVSQMKVGEPLTRTLTLVAKGTTVGQLPELNVAKRDDGIKQYPDQPLLNEDKKPDGLMASRQEKIALIPANAGTYVLPAIEIPWFNTRTQAMEMAKIAARTIKVAAAAPNNPPVPATVPQSLETKQPSASTKAVAGEGIMWMWVSAGLACAWLATLVYFLTRRLPGHELGAAKPQVDENNDWHKSLKLACAGNDPETAKTALLNWGMRQFGATSLSALAPLCDTRLGEEIMGLNQVLYGRETGAWQGQKLWQALKDNKSGKQTEKQEASPLEPLFRL